MLGGRNSAGGHHSGAGDPCRVSWVDGTQRWPDRSRCRDSRMDRVAGNTPGISSKHRHPGRWLGDGRASSVPRTELGGEWRPSAAATRCSAHRSNDRPAGSPRSSSSSRTPRAAWRARWPGTARGRSPSTCGRTARLQMNAAWPKLERAPGAGPLGRQWLVLAGPPGRAVPPARRRPSPAGRRPGTIGAMIETDIALRPAAVDDAPRIADPVHRGGLSRRRVGDREPGSAGSARTTRPSSWPTTTARSWASSRSTSCPASSTTNSFVRIVALVVDSTVRERGIGRILMAEAERIGPSTASSFVEVTAGHHRPEARHLYESLGLDARNLTGVPEEATPWPLRNSRTSACGVPRRP